MRTFRHYKDKLYTLVGIAEITRAAPRLVDNLMIVAEHTENGAFVFVGSDEDGKLKAWYMSTHHSLPSRDEVKKNLAIYRAEYGERLVWARPEEMFFGKLEDGRKRFEEVEQDS